MYKFFLFISFLFLTTSCDNKNNEIIKITFATDDGEGKLPSQVFEIDYKGKIKYYGQEKEKNIGFYSGEVNQKFLDTLNLKLEKINYKELDTSFISSGIDDDSFVEIFVYSKENKKHFIGQYSKMPYELKSFIDWITKSSINFKLVQTKENYVFPTEIPLRVNDENIRFKKKGS